MLGIFRGPRPDITPAMAGGFLLAGVPVIANLLTVFGVYDVSAEQQEALKQAIQWGVIGAGALVLGDTGLRVGRNHADAKVQGAALVRATEPASGVIGEDELADGLPTDEEEFADDEELAAPPPDESNTPVQPSQTGLTDSL